MRRLLGLAAATLATVSFQNCAKANFATSDAALTQSVAGFTNPPDIPAGSTICADFGAAEGEASAACDPGHAFVGELYVEPRNTLIMRSHGGGDLLAGPHASLAALMQPQWLQGAVLNGVMQPYQLVSSSFDLTGQFLNNFHAVDGTSIMVPDADGQYRTVSAWFALSMTAKFHLDAQDAPGADYQFALVSDDGSQLMYLPDGATQYQMLVDNETPESVGDGFFIPGTQYVRMGCGAVLNTTASVITIKSLAAGRTVPLKLNYFNGPQGLTLHLLYRPVPADGPADVMCETDVNGGDHKSPVVKSSPLLDYASLKGRGWKVVGSANL